MALTIATLFYRKAEINDAGIARFIQILLDLVNMKQERQEDRHIWRILRQRAKKAWDNQGVIAAHQHTLILHFGDKKVTYLMTRGTGSSYVRDLTSLANVCQYNWSAMSGVINREAYDRIMANRVMKTQGSSRAPRHIGADIKKARRTILQCPSKEPNVIKKHIQHCSRPLSCKELADLGGKINEHGLLSPQRGIIGPKESLLSYHNDKDNAHGILEETVPSTRLEEPASGESTDDGDPDTTTTTQLTKRRTASKQYSQIYTSTHVRPHKLRKVSTRDRVVTEASSANPAPTNDPRTDSATINLPLDSIATTNLPSNNADLHYEDNDDMHRGAVSDAEICRRSADPLSIPSDQHDDCVCEASLPKVMSKIIEIIQASDDLTQQSARQMVRQIFHGTESLSVCRKHWPKTVRILGTLAKELNDWLPTMEEDRYTGGTEEGHVSES